MLGMTMWLISGCVVKEKKSLIQQPGIEKERPPSSILKRVCTPSAGALGCGATGASDGASGHSYAAPAKGDR